MSSNCKHCKKPLVKIGLDRVNGKGTYNDWSSRLYHKKCLKELEQIKYCILLSKS